jgi:hypothetical protein
MVKIEVKRTGNCPCVNCGEVQDGYKMHPFNVWHKSINEKRGHNEPVCSIKCANELAKKFS